MFAEWLLTGVGGKVSSPAGMGGFNHVFYIHFISPNSGSEREYRQSDTHKYTLNIQIYKYTNPNTRIPRWRQLDCMTSQIYYFIN